MSSTVSSIASTVISTAISATTSAASSSSTASGAHGGSKENRPPAYKAAGLGFAIASGIFIGVSFVLKKKGLLQSNLKENTKPGEGVAYLKNKWWWIGMILMILGEVFNFIAYAFVDAILVTPLGALSVVVTAILSSIFLKERLSFVGKIGCFVCIIGAIIIAISAPEQSSAATIQDMKFYVLSPGFLSYAGVIIVGCIFIIWWAGPRYGEKSMMVYLTVCSLIGSLSVVATQGLGAAVLSQIAGKPQFNQWFLYVLLVFIIITLLTEIYYLNKALNLFNAALVTPTYYVFFTSSTIVTSAVLFRGFKGSPMAIATLVMGFLEICSGVILLQLSKSAKDVPDTEIFRGDLDQVRAVAEQEEPEFEPKADTIRGTAALIRRLSTVRQTAEAKEAAKFRKEKLRELQEGMTEDEVHFDGLRRRVTFAGEGGGRPRRNTSASQHAWSGLSASRMEEMEEGRISSDLMRIPTRPAETDTENEKILNEKGEEAQADEDGNNGTKKRVKHIFVPKAASHQDLRKSPVGTPLPSFHIPDSASPAESGSASPKKSSITFVPTSPNLKPADSDGSGGSGNRERSESASTYMSGGLRPSTAGTGKQASKRQFSFQTLFHRHHHHHNDHQQVDQIEDDEDVEHSALPSPNLNEGPSGRLGTAASASLPKLAPVPSSTGQSEQSPSPDGLKRFQTEEESLGLVSGDRSSLKGSISAPSLVPGAKRK